MFIPDPDFYPSRIPDPTTAAKEEGEKLVVLPFTKIWVWDPGSEIRDPGSEIRDTGSEIRVPRYGCRKKPIPDPGFRRKKAPNPRSRSATLNSATKIHADLLGSRIDIFRL
jgi:hypothetical protein